MQHRFNGKGGQCPGDGLVFDNAGSLYGTTLGGGVGKCRYSAAACSRISNSPQSVGVRQHGCCNQAISVRRERRWSTAGEKTRPGTGSLHPVAIGAAVEATKPLKPLVERVA